MFVAEIDEPSAEQRISCVRCHLCKPTDDFNPRSGRPGQRDTHCRPGQAAYQHEHYVTHRERYIQNAGTRRRAASVERMSYLLGFFETHPCSDCGETDPSVLEFDHRGEKAFNVSHGMQGHSWSRVLVEIAKCDVRCVNCHRRETARELGFYRARLLATGDAPLAESLSGSAHLQLSGRRESNPR
jgi:hypothetical protein